MLHITKPKGIYRKQQSENPLRVKGKCNFCIKVAFGIFISFFDKSNLFLNNSEDKLQGSLHVKKCIA